MQPLRITVIDHQTQSVVMTAEFAQFPVRIGRVAGNDVVLAYPFISAWHAEIRGAAGPPQLCDLGSRNGLSIGAQRVPSGGSVALAGRVVATIGALELRFEPATAEAESPAAPVDDGPDILGVGPPRPAPPPAAGTIDDALPIFEGDDGGHAERVARLHTAIHELRPRHAQLEAARRAWESGLARAVHGLEAADDRHSVGVLLREFPARDRGDFSRNNLARTDADGFPGAHERGVLAQAAGELLPGLRVPGDDDESRRFLARVIDVLRVFAACALELQHARGQQATELGVAWQGPTDPLAAAESVEDLLRYLLDWRDAGEKRSEELVRMFAGLVDHQRAYVRAGLLAARESVTSLAPAEIERGAQAAWPTRAAALWRHYEATYAALAGEVHDHLTPVFRAALARGYAEALARAGVAFHARNPPEAP